MPNSGPEMIIVPEDNLTVQELADKLSLESSEIIKSLFFKGITATVTQSLDLATIETVAEELGVPVLNDAEEAAKKTVDMIETDDIENLSKGLQRLQLWVMLTMANKSFRFH